MATDESSPSEPLLNNAAACEDLVESLRSPQPERREGALIRCASDSTDGLQLCPACRYPREGLDSCRCPECGYEVTNADLNQHLRRWTFLELTRWPAWRGILIQAGLALYLDVWPLIPLAAAMGLGWWMYRKRIWLHRRILRRAWILIVPWVQVCWIVPRLLLGAIDLLHWSTSLLDTIYHVLNPWYWYWPWWLYLPRLIDSSDDVPVCSLGVSPTDGHRRTNRSSVRAFETRTACLADHRAVRFRADHRRDSDRGRHVHPEPIVAYRWVMR